MKTGTRPRQERQAPSPVYRPPAPLGGRRRTGRGLRQGRSATAFLLPALTILSVFVAWPILSALRLSFTDASGFGQTHWVGLDNYKRIIEDPKILDAVQNTVVYAALFTPLTVGLALALAMLLNNPRLPFRGMFRTSLFLPFVISLAVAAIAWSYLIDPQRGLLTYWLRGINIELGDALQDPQLAMPAVVLVAVWKNFGFYMVIYLAGLQEIPGTLYEAAQIDGAGVWARFRHITIPQLANTHAFVFIFAMIAALQAFDQIYVMTRGGPYGSTQTVVMEIYDTGFKRLDLGMASALSYLLLIATLLLSLAQFAFFRRKETEGE